MSQPRAGRLPLPIPVPAPRGGGGDRVNVGAPRELTDDSGGRTELIRAARDLDPATASVADELSRQGYVATP